jgi:P pilus assembly chaperone PapD
MGCRAGVVVLVAALCLSDAPPVRAQGVVISPHHVFIPETGKTTTVDVHNSGTTSADITVGMIFGSYRTDSLGGIVVVSEANPPAGAPDATPWIQVYPKHMILRPGQRQSIKVLAVPPANLAAGEYRTRLLIGVRELSLPAPVVEAGETRVALNFEIQTSISLIYRAGATTTGVKLSDIRVTVNGDYLDVRMHLEKTGNGSYFGRLRGGLLDERNRVLVPLEVALGLNESMEPRFRMPLGKLRSGTYTLRLAMANERTDIPPEDLLPAPRAVWEGKIAVQRGY